MNPLLEKTLPILKGLTSFVKILILIFKKMAFPVSMLLLLLVAIIQLSSGMLSKVELIYKSTPNLMESLFVLKFESFLNEVLNFFVSLFPFMLQVPDWKLLSLDWLFTVYIIIALFAYRMKYKTDFSGFLSFLKYGKLVFLVIKVLYDHNVILRFMYGGGLPEESRSLLPLSYRLYFLCILFVILIHMIEKKGWKHD